MRETRRKAQKCSLPRSCAKSAKMRGKPAEKGRNGLFGTFGAILSEIGPESTSMVFTQKSHSERFVCQKSELLLLSRPSAPKGCDRCIFSRGAPFLSARTLKTSEFLDPDSGPILTRICKSAKSAKMRETRRKVVQRPRKHLGCTRLGKPLISETCKGILLKRRQRS